MRTMTMTPRTRTLKHGEPMPMGTPLRYLDQAGYVVLRWRVGLGEFVQCREHRFVMGVPPSHLHVHHKNGVKDDNRPENLEVVTPSEHGKEHRTMDRALLVKLYLSGCSTTEISRRTGHDAAAIYRAIRELGVQMRSPGESLRKDIRKDVLRDLVRAGISARRIAGFLGVSGPTVLNHMKALGLPSRRQGRPTPAEEAEWDEFLAGYEMPEEPIAYADVNRLPVLRHP